MSDLDLDAVLSEPAFFPHRIDVENNQIVFVPTFPEWLARPSFIDGRSDFSAGPSLTFPLDAVLAAGEERPAGPDRMIFHVSFCGSTLLARMLELPGSAFVLKEPNALVDLADLKKAGGQIGPALEWLRASLRRRWQADEPVVVKPSNWANNLLPELTADPAAIRPVFVTMARRPFLIAVLRGGRDRLAFTARAAAHLAPAAQLQAAISASDDPLTRAVHLAAVTLYVQMSAFAAVCRKGQAIDAAELTGAPVEAALTTNRMLDLGIDPELLARNAASKSGEDSKNPGRAFTPAGRASDDDSVEQHHGSMLDSVLVWAERVLGPHPSLG